MGRERLKFLRVTAFYVWGCTFEIIVCISGNTHVFSDTFDVYRPAQGRIILVDFNPFGITTDSLLFSWSEFRVSGSDNSEVSSYPRSISCRTSFLSNLN